MQTIAMTASLALATMGLGPAFPVPAQARQPFAPARLRIEPGGRVDLGELGPLEVRILNYTITNASAAPVTLRVLDLSPGVTVAGPALQRPIPPSGAARLALRVDPADWVGPQARNVRLGTDDPGQGAYYLPIRMTVRADLTVDGQRRSFGDVAAHESPVVRFNFVRETGKPLALWLATALPAYLECEIRAEGPRAQLAFTLRPGRIPPGMRLGLEPVRVESNAPLQPGFDLYLEWRLHHAIEALPARLVFTGPEDTLPLRLKSRQGTAFRILGAVLEGDGFQLGPLPEGAAPEQVLRIRRTATTTCRAMLVLRCSGQDEPLRIPVAYVPDRPANDGDVIAVPHAVPLIQVPDRKQARVGRQKYMQHPGPWLP